MSTSTTAQFSDVIRFHGLNLLVVSHDSEEYLPIRPVCELIGVDWRTQKRALEDPYGVEMYGTRWLRIHKMDGFPELKLAENCYLRLNRVHFFLARINPRRVEANGNSGAARWLMDLHHEWANALHAYETHGVAIKPGRSNALRELHQLIRSREHLRDAGERAMLTTLIQAEFKALGLSPDTLDEAQPELPLFAAKVA